MYASLKKWVDIPIIIKPFIGRSATGSKLFGSDIPALCYPQGEVKIVRNWQGVEVVSYTHLYVEGSTVVTELDDIFFEGKQRPVQAVSTFYRAGQPDIKVVYI